MTSLPAYKKFERGICPHRSTFPTGKRATERYFETKCYGCGAKFLRVIR